jgi:hypothetical protein
MGVWNSRPGQVHETLTSTPSPLPSPLDTTYYLPLVHLVCVRFLSPDIANSLSLMTLTPGILPSTEIISLLTPIWDHLIPYIRLRSSLSTHQFDWLRSFLLQGSTHTTVGLRLSLSQFPFMYTSYNYWIHHYIHLLCRSPTGFTGTNTNNHNCGGGDGEKGVTSPGGVFIVLFYILFYSYTQVHSHTKHRRHLLLDCLWGGRTSSPRPSWDCVSIRLTFQIFFTNLLNLTTNLQVCVCVIDTQNEWRGSFLFYRVVQSNRR